MKSQDIEHIKSRIDVLKAELKHEHSLPKAQRNQRAIESVKVKIDMLTSWIKPVKNNHQVKKTSISKENFRAAVKDSLGMAGKADTEIEIPDMATLNDVWNKIRLKCFSGTLQIKAPVEVREEIKNRMRKNPLPKVKGFR